MPRAISIPTIPRTRLLVSPEVRAKLEDAAERIVRILDLLDADPDLEPAGDEQDQSYREEFAQNQRGAEHPLEDQEDDGSAEPSLGSINETYGGSQLNWSAGSTDDREGDEHDGSEPEEDEPSLGACEHHPGAFGGGSQLSWGIGSTDDREVNDDDLPQQDAGDEGEVDEDTGIGDHDGMWEQIGMCV